MLGATGLRNQYIVLKVESIDEAVLRRKLVESGRSGAIAPLVALATDNAPRAVLDLALPVAEEKLAEYGVRATVRAADAPPGPERKKMSEFFPGAALGAGVAALVIGAGVGVWKLLFGRIFR